MPFQVVGCYSLVALFRVGNLCDAPLLLKQVQRLWGSRFCEFNDPLQFRILLAADFPEVRDFHIVREKLSDWRTGLDGLMLFLVTDEHDALDPLLACGVEQGVAVAESMRLDSSANHSSGPRRSGRGFP